MYVGKTKGEGGEGRREREGGWKVGGRHLSNLLSLVFFFWGFGEKDDDNTQMFILSVDMSVALSTLTEVTFNHVCGHSLV